MRKWIASRASVGVSTVSLARSYTGVKGKVKKLTTIGIGTTAAYSLVIALLVGDRVGQLNTMPLNELGDFLAGVFGPLAIFWLILGFLQQGKELQQSTRALELQAHELNNSVQQQRELVAVSREQMKAELESLRFERQRQLDMAKPHFISLAIGASHSGAGKSAFTVKISNTGATATNVTIEAAGGIDLKPNNFPTWQTNVTQIIKWEYVKGQSSKRSEFIIHYTDSLGNLGAEEFVITITNGEKHPDAKVHKKR